MLEALNQYFLQSLINSVAVIYVLSKLLNEKISLKNYRIYITLLLFILFSLITYFEVNNLVRFFIMTIVVFLGNYYLFRKNLKETLISTIVEQLLIFIVEIIVTIFLIFAFKFETSQIRYNLLGNIIIVLSISCLIVILAKINFANKIYLFVYNLTLKINTKYLIIYSLIMIISTNFLYVSNFLELEIYEIFIINMLLVLIYTFILFYALFKQNENLHFKEENLYLINNLNEYEKMLDYQRVNNHENKNQLLVIKSMVEKKDEKAVEYINEIIKEKREDNEVVYTKAKRIPSGGLQGLIYQKMLLMQENNIEVILDVGTQVRKIDLSNISSKMNYDICRIVGIILDNAIEETIKFNKKDREIIISMYVDDFFFIEVSNRIKDNIDINKISEKGYTTKTKGHGYGLSLLTKIVNENNNIYNEIRVINNIFTQIVKIKM